LDDLFRVIPDDVDFSINLIRIIVIYEIMELTNKEIDVLHIIVQKELDSVKKDAKKVMISNAGFITRPDTGNDFEFLKQEEMYESFLKSLLSKLRNGR
jgi:hypothetical protein